MGGGNDAACASGEYRRGLSPRGRGKRQSGIQSSTPAGSIPAWAGETPALSFRRRPFGVYPRVGGGNRVAALLTLSSAGLSPRGRGKPTANRNRVLLPRSIPAWAGETNSNMASIALSRVYPRVGGGNSIAPYPFVNIGGLSPRGRGKHLPGYVLWVLTGSIPAWAGETRGQREDAAERRVYPRVGGGNSKRKEPPQDT